MLTLRALADQVADLPSHQSTPPPVVASSGQEWQFTFLLLELILVDQVADLHWHIDIWQTDDILSYPLSLSI